MVRRCFGPPVPTIPKAAACGRTSRRRSLSQPRRHALRVERDLVRTMIDLAEADGALVLADEKREKAVGIVNVRRVQWAS